MRKNMIIIITIHHHLHPTCAYRHDHNIHGMFLSFTSSPLQVISLLLCHDRSRSPSSLRQLKPQEYHRETVRASFSQLQYEPKALLIQGMSAPHCYHANTLYPYNLTTLFSAALPLSRNLFNPESHKSQVSNPGLVLCVPHVWCWLCLGHHTWSDSERLSLKAEKITRLLPSQVATRLNTCLSIRTCLLSPPFCISTIFRLQSSPRCHASKSTPSPIFALQWWSTVHGKGLNIYDRSKSSSLIDMA